MYRILLCDDEEDIILALKAYLNHPDYEFYEAHNGQEACSDRHGYHDAGNGWNHCHEGDPRNL